MTIITPRYEWNNRISSATETLILFLRESPGKTTKPATSKCGIYSITTPDGGVWRWVLIIVMDNHPRPRQMGFSSEFQFHLIAELLANMKL